MTTFRGSLWPSVAVATLAIAAGACNMLDVYDRQIANASRAIDSAKSDAERAAAFADRGRGYSDKARLSILRNVIDRDEYLRLFDLAVKDHDQAVTLDPDNADIVFKRGLSYYDRAAQVRAVAVAVGGGFGVDVDVDHGPWFDAARADFAKAIEKDPRHALAYDYLGMVDEQTERFDEAIADFTHEMALDSRGGRMRLAELYCTRGQSHLKEKRYDPAAADLEKSIEMGGAADSCSCEPYNSLAYIYVDVARDYDKGWALVRKARGSGQWIAPEYVDRLKKGSGQNG